MVIALDRKSEYSAKRRKRGVGAITGNSDPRSLDDIYPDRDVRDDADHLLHMKAAKRREAYERAMRDQYLPENDAPPEELAAWKSLVDDAARRQFSGSA